MWAKHETYERERKNSLISIIYLGNCTICTWTRARDFCPCEASWIHSWSICSRIWHFNHATDDRSQRSCTQCSKTLVWWQNKGNSSSKPRSMGYARKTGSLWLIKLHSIHKTMNLVSHRNRSENLGHCMFCSTTVCQRKWSQVFFSHSQNGFPFFIAILLGTLLPSCNESRQTQECQFLVSLAFANTPWASIKSSRCSSIWSKTSKGFNLLSLYCPERHPSTLKWNELVTQCWESLHNVFKPKMSSKQRHKHYQTFALKWTSNWVEWILFSYQPFALEYSVNQ